VVVLCLDEGGCFGGGVAPTGEIVVLPPHRIVREEGGKIEWECGEVWFREKGGTF
jgi:hypothetical protein